MIIRFPITPQTWLHITQAAKTLFRIPENCPKNCGLPRKKKAGDEYGCPHMIAQEGLNKRRRMLKYADYKTDLLAIAKQKNYALERAGTAIYFFIPIPVRWWKRKRDTYHGQWHDQTPDLSNLLKAFEDAIMPKRDHLVGHYAELGKYWVDTTYKDASGKLVAGPGWIEVHTNKNYYDPFGRLKQAENAVKDDLPKPKYIDQPLPFREIMAKTMDMNMQVKPPRQMPKQLVDKTSTGPGDEIVPDKMSVEEFNKHFRDRANFKKRKK